MHRKSYTYLVIIGPNSFEKLTKYKIRSRYYLPKFRFIYPYAAILYHFGKYLVLITYIYPYLSIFTAFSLIYPYFVIFALIFPEMTICAIFTLHSHIWSCMVCELTFWWNQGHWVFSGLCFINQAPYNQSWLETHNIIGRHIWPISSSQDIWPWMTFEGQIQVT